MAAKTGIAQIMQDLNDDEATETRALLKKVAKVKKTIMKKPSKAASKPSKTPVVAADPIKKRPAAATTEYTKDKPPAFGTPCPLTFNGCRVLQNHGRHRVFPSKDSVYDKGFPFIDATQQALWGAVLNFCLKPSVPVGSVNHPKSKAKKR